jgi:hypothetical protein
MKHAITRKGADLHMSRIDERPLDWWMGVDVFSVVSITSKR